MKYYTTNVDPSQLIVVANRPGAGMSGKCRVRQATKEELDELDKLFGPVDKSILAPNGGAKGIYALQEPHFRMPRNPAREEAEAKARAKKKAAFRAAKEKNQVKYITRKVGGQNEEVSRESESHSLPRH